MLNKIALTSDVTHTTTAQATDRILEPVPDASTAAKTKTTKKNT